jgi:DNA topoisomerase-1
LGDLKIESITLEQAIEILKYPKTLGKYKNKDIVLKKGKFGLYIVYDKQNYSINSETEIDLSQATTIIKSKTESESSEAPSNIIKKINEKITIKTGPYGSYISYLNNKKYHNIKIFNKNPREITEEDCMTLIQKKFSKK